MISPEHSQILEGHVRRSASAHMMIPLHQRQSSASAESNQENWFERNLHDFISVPQPYLLGGVGVRHHQQQQRQQKQQPEVATPKRQLSRSGSNTTGSFVRSRTNSFAASDSSPPGNGTPQSTLSRASLAATATTPTSANNESDNSNNSSREGPFWDYAALMASLSPWINRSTSRKGLACMLRREQSDRTLTINQSSQCSSPPPQHQPENQQDAPNPSAPTVFQRGNSDRLMNIPEMSSQEMDHLKLPHSSVALKCPGDAPPRLERSLSATLAFNHAASGGSKCHTPRDGGRALSRPPFTPSRSSNSLLTSSVGAVAAAASMNASMQRLCQHRQEHSKSSGNANSGDPSTSTGGTFTPVRSNPAHANRFRRVASHSDVPVLA